MKEPRWIPLDVVQALHDMQLTAFGGHSGIRDQGLLESALGRPQNRFACGGKQLTLARLAASYAFGIVRNHPFADGNKRTGLVVAFVFLELNGWEVTATEEDTYQVFIDLAAGKISEPALATWLQKHARRW